MLLVRDGYLLVRSWFLGDSRIIHWWFTGVIGVSRVVHGTGGSPVFHGCFVGVDVDSLSRRHQNSTFVACVATKFACWLGLPPSKTRLISELGHVWGPDQILVNLAWLFSGPRRDSRQHSLAHFGAPTRFKSKLCGPVWCPDQILVNLVWLLLWPRQGSNQHGLARLGPRPDSSQSRLALFGAPTRF